MEITRGVRLLLCALPQPGWGGTDLAGYTQALEARPDVNANEEEAASTLARLTEEGLAQCPEPDRWELSEAGRAALETVADNRQLAASEVLLDLQPGAPPAPATDDGQEG